MNIKDYNDNISMFYDNYLSLVQDEIKKLLPNKPYNIKEEDVENFNDLLIKQMDNNENVIITIIQDNMGKNVDAKTTAKLFLDKWYNKIYANFFTKDVQNDIPVVIKNEKIIISFNDFIKQKKQL